MFSWRRFPIPIRTNLAMYFGCFLFSLLFIYLYIKKKKSSSKRRQEGMRDKSRRRRRIKKKKKKKI